MYAHNFETFSDRLEAFEGSQPQAVVSYLRETWLPFKEKFVTAWTKWIPHLGNSTSSRAESTHAAIKLFIRKSTSGLLEVFDDLTRAIDHQHSAIATRISYEQINLLQHLPSCTLMVQGKVSHVALLEVKKVAGEQIPADDRCTGSRKVSLGLPCAHRVKEAVQNQHMLTMEDFHPQWHLINPVSISFYPFICMILETN